MTGDGEEEAFGLGEVIAGDPLEEADDGADTRIQPFVDPDVQLCPVVPLGFEGGKVVFAMPEGEIRKEPAAKIGTMLRPDIFACAPGQAFLANWRDKEGKFQRELATVWFVRTCRKAGLWDSGRQVRSLGVWPADAAGAPGGLVLHLGDEVWRLAHRQPAEKLKVIETLRERRGPLYKLRPPAPRPAKPASSADGLWVMDRLALWRFEPIGREGLTGADVVGGWAMAGLLGALAPFRGHCLVNAMAGSGKSALVAFVHALQSALAGDVIDAFSEAGLRNELSGMARPVLLDEAESAPGAHGPGVVERALELVRRMSTGSGGHRVMGDIGGGSISQTAVGAVLMAAINPPKLGPADGSRIVEVRLLPLSGSDLAAGETVKLADRAELQGAIDKAHQLGPALLGRALRGAWRYLADVDELAAAFARAGESPRTADLISMLAAGRRMLLFDAALTPQEADAEVAFWRPLLDQRTAAEIVSNPGADCLAHLMAAESGLHLSNRRETLGGIIQRWVRLEREYDDVLKSNGLKIWEGLGPDGREGPWLLVANHHPRLEAIFRGTVWADWRRTLGYLDGLGPAHRTWPAKKQRFGVGVEQRAIAIPLAPWIDKPSARMAAGVTPMPRSAAVPAGVPEEDVDWPDEFT
ncbi:MAG: hypothetical protein JF588_19330 [Caulobacterales bacterium]|nr:hypothetical protein [Caulobacterales bacterium]